MRRPLMTAQQRGQRPPLQRPWASSPRQSANSYWCCATAIGVVASQRPLQRSRLCSFSAAGLGRPASMLRDGHYNGRVSAAVTTVHMQSFRRGHRLPRVVAARRPLQWSRLGGRYNGRAYNQSCGQARSAHFNKWRAIALARRSRYCATAIGMVASRRPLQRSRLQSVF